MKKSGFILMLLIITLISAPISFAGGNISVHINGSELAMDEPPVIVNGRTLIPLRAIFEALNVTPQWDSATKTVSAKTNEIEMKLKIGSQDAVVNGKVIKLDTPGTLVNGRTMVPARFIAETLGANVDWDSNTRTVKITSADNISSTSTQTPNNKTVHANAYVHIKNFMNQFEKNKFNQVIKLGNIETYRTELLDTNIIINTKYKEQAEYDPKSNTITLSADPSRISESDSLFIGQLIWHEVTHKIEDVNGDIGYFDSTEYAERNIEYMKNIIQVVIPKLEQLESYNGNDNEQIKKLWNNFVKAYDEALNLPEVKAYPPNKEMLKKWFGFSVDKDELLEFYKSGKGGEKIKNALTDAPASVWSGSWNTNFGVLVMTQSGNSVSGTYSHDSGSLKGTVSGNTLSGSWVEDDDKGTFTFTIDSNGKAFNGSWQETSPNPNQSGGWNGKKQ